jgi:hypothetical protein
LTRIWQDDADLDGVLGMTSGRQQARRESDGAGEKTTLHFILPFYYLLARMPHPGDKEKRRELCGSRRRLESWSL